MFSHIPTEARLATDKLNADTVDAGLHNAASLWRLWHIQKITSKPQPLRAFLRSIDDSNRNATINAMPIEISDPIPTVDIAHSVRESAHDETLAPVSRFDGHAIRDSDALKLARSTVNVPNLDAP
jgi:hypothetical protein